MKVYVLKNLEGEYGFVGRLGLEWTKDLSSASLYSELGDLQIFCRTHAYTQPIAVVECELREVETLPNEEYFLELAKKILREHHYVFEKLAE